MKSAVATLAFAMAIPAAYSIFISGGTIGAGFGLPLITLGGTGTTAGTAATTAIGITGLTAASATLAGVGGLVAVVGAGAVLGGLAAAAVRGAGSGGGSSRRGGRRGKRSPVNQEMIGEQFVFDAIATMDTIDCGKRYLCEIAATPLDELTQEELSSLLLFQSAPGAPGSGKSDFDEAVRLGAVSRNPNTCQIRYKSCQTVDVDSSSLQQNQL